VEVKCRSPPVPHPRRALSRFDTRELVAVFAGGVVGALLRAAFALGLPPAPGGWPWATFVVNVIGAFLLGYFVTLLQERLPLSTYRRPLIGSGICGALTTFSTMQLELLELLDGGHALLAGTYALASVVAGFLAVFVATAVVRRVQVA
jgi:fluoride exporter